MSSTSSSSERSEILSTLLPQVIATVAERWQTYWPERSNQPPPRIACPRGADSRGYSVLFELWVRFSAQSVERVIVKLRRESQYGAFEADKIGSKARDLAVSEFEELSRAHQFFASRQEGLSVVGPYDYVPALNAILVARATGIDLGLVVKRGTPDPFPHLVRCGRWLNLYHSALHHPAVRQWSTGEFDAQFARRCDRLRRRGVPAAVLNDLAAGVRDVARDSLPAQITRSTAHGDFKLRHIWADATRIQVFDFGNIHEGDCYEDVAAFVTELEALEFGSIWKTVPTAAYAHGFLQAYFESEAVPPPFRLAVVDALMKKWERRLLRWGHDPLARRLQTGLSRVGVNAVVERRYTDRWFASRIR